MIRKYLYSVSLYTLLLGGCQQNWSSEESSGLKELERDLIEKINLQTEMRLAMLNVAVERGGAREADVLVRTNAKEAINTIHHSHLDSLRNWIPRGLSDIFDQGLSQSMTDLDRGLNGQVMLWRALTANRVASYYGQMVNYRSMFDIPEIRLWQSIDEPGLFMTAIGSSTDIVRLYIRKTDDGVVEIIDPLLNIRQEQIQWKMIFSGKVLWNEGLE